MLSNGITIFENRNDLSDLMGQAWVEHVFARHALDRLSRVQAEAACNAVHQVPHRTANWIRRLYETSGPELRTTQSILAQAMGVQRTSVNAAVKALERDGALKLSRGRMIVTDPARLHRFTELLRVGSLRDIINFIHEAAAPLVHES